MRKKNLKKRRKKAEKNTARNIYGKEKEAGDETETGKEKKIKENRKRKTEIDFTEVFYQDPSDCE